ncbi:hypothetical protein Hanom_Chr04g00350531 [Helianthus anomalus]
MVWRGFGAWVLWACEKMEFFFFKYSRWPTASPTTLSFWPFTNRHVTLLPRSTPGLKPKPQEATPQPKPTRDGDLGFLPQPTPKPSPHTPRPYVTIRKVCSIIGMLSFRPNDVIVFRNQ